MNAQPSILVVDDEPNNFDVIETFLHNEGYELNYASSGQKAIDRLDTVQPDVILLDVMMPDLDGLEVCRRIKAQVRWQVVPIIVVTALTAKEDLARCLAAGADDFISKPINGMELRARTRSMLRIKQQYDDLQSLLQVREDMVHMIVHDLRNPLTSVLLSTEMLRLPGLSSEKQQKKVEQIAIAGSQLQSLIDSLLLLAKLESGKMTLNCTEIDLAQLCMAAVTDLEAIAAQKQLRLLAQLPDGGEPVTVDVPVFRRVLDNLLSNAIKFAPRKSQVLITTDYLESGEAIVRVTDSGPGVSEVLKQHIFERYEIGTLINGTSQIGLGLAFCKMAIEAHGGQITVEDNQPQGTVFSILLPRLAT
ncbi:hybrid sensor histidine kinase/response regulator [Oculatella sp. LEGE 06141]|uniref:hybrid sensor histidine kinase/response regulator n=1 Tax=Oculatella sp. LEGE 06141 TaxID=1828648 RepID=UPI0018801ACD|nr:hybrid sensor histidine kinase/response regulator [Oculatella sp. LEGE 06141]MBE9180411.1 hybrid sensor histidine kinase/response regulator [Oculatella sp. LEGE 06141]